MCVIVPRELMVHDLAKEEANAAATISQAVAEAEEAKAKNEEDSSDSDSDSDSSSSSSDSDSDSDDEAGKPSLGRTQLDQVKSVALIWNSHIGLTRLN